MVGVMYGRVAIGKKDGYWSLKVTDENFAGKINKRLPFAYGNIMARIAQIPIQHNGEDFLFIHAYSQPFLLCHRGYELSKDDGKTEEILRQFLKSPESGRWAKTIENKILKFPNNN